jgi:hypothetical protein
MRVVRFEVGDLVTYKTFAPGEIHNRPDRIFKIILCKEERCTLEQVSNGQVLRISFLYRLLRKLTDAEKILYGTGT